MDKSKAIEEIQKIDLLLYHQMLTFSPEQWEKYETSTKEYYAKGLCCSSFEAENSGFVKDMHICCGMAKEISDFVINTDDVTLYKFYIEKISATSEELLQNLNRLSEYLGKDFLISLYIKNLFAIRANLRHLHEWAKIYHSKAFKEITQQSANNGQISAKEKKEKRKPFSGKWNETGITQLFNELKSKNYIAENSDLHWFLCAFGCAEDNATEATEARSKTTWVKYAIRNRKTNVACLLYLLDGMECEGISEEKINQWFVAKDIDHIDKQSISYYYNEKNRSCDKTLADELDNILDNIEELKIYNYD